MKRMKASIMSVIMALGLFAGPAAGAADQALSFWTTEVEKDRMRVQEDLAREFEDRTGIGVKVVPVEENRLAERITAAFAAGSLPDVVFHPMDFSMGWLEAGVLDPKAAKEVVTGLGEGTFGAGPLALVGRDGFPAAVPADGWGQLLLYRKDLFREKGLEAPDTWDRILKAAGALHDPPLMWGFEAATDPGQVYTQQVFEHFALSNGVRLTGPDGGVRLNTPEMKETLRFYRKLADFGPPGNLYWLHTRMDYLSGRAAMIVWSPFILDELSGLRQDQPVVPDKAKGEEGYLARNTGFVTVVKGPNGSAQYGQVNCLGITTDADAPAAKKWVSFLLSEGYTRWLGMAAEGKLPVRKGTEDDPGRFMREWMELEFGVTTRARISEYYGEDVVRALTAGLDGFDRWGFGEGRGALVGRIYGTKVVPEVLKRFLDGELDEDGAVRLMEEKVRALE